MGASEKHAMWGGGLRMHTKPWVRARANKDYWNKLNPSTGRPYSAGMSKPDNWGVTKGMDILKQQKDMTTDEQLEKLRINFLGGFIIYLFCIPFFLNIITPKPSYGFDL